MTMYPTLIKYFGKWSQHSPLKTNYTDDRFKLLSLKKRHITSKVPSRK